VAACRRRRRGGASISALAFTSRRFAAARAVACVTCNVLAGAARNNGGIAAGLPSAYHASSPLCLCALRLFGGVACVLTYLRRCYASWRLFSIALSLVRGLRMARACCCA